ncbi:MAG: hypothetical protein R3C16_08440 [Hyphomonadaceae bacterium]
MTRAAASDTQRDPGALIGVLAMTVAGLWLVGSVVAAIALIGPDRLTDLTPVEIGAVAAAVLLPALMAVFSGVAARESARARAEARRLADAADRLLNPEQSSEEAARKLAMSVRGEISQLDRALETTLSRLQEVEGLIARQAETVDAMAGQARAGAGHMITGMERERAELMRISQELTSQAQTIGDSISRHTTSISEAARVAEAEVRAADQALDHRLTSFGAAAALITDRTQALSTAAQTSADSALRLEHALSNALDVLAKATNLTDAARQSAEAASLAANSTAGAVRETTGRAIEDAKRAADLIRGEAANVEREAAVALERLRDAADAARSAAIGARNAVEDERQTRGRTPRAPALEREPEPDFEPPPELPRYDRSWRTEPDPLEAAPPPRNRGRTPPPAPERDDAMFGEREAPPQGEWTWRDLLSNVDENAPAQQQRPARRGGGGEDALARLQHQISDPHGGSGLSIVATLEQAGLHLDEVFSPSGLERIAQRARSGTQARRRAVREAAPEAARRLADFLARNARANQDAMLFLRRDGQRIAELIGRGRASMGAEATRAFLLIDAAAG